MTEDGPGPRAGDESAIVGPRAALRGADGDLDARTRALLAELAARPRPAGGAAEAGARNRCERWLTESGFAVEERRFDYSALPGRWGTPLVGAVSAAALAASAVCGAAGGALGGLGILGGAALVMALTGRWMARRGVLALPLLRRRSANLVATRGRRPPTVWLVAHLDSKSQPVSIGLRALGVMGLLALLPTAAAALLASAAGAAPPAATWTLLAAAGVACALPVIASTVGDRSTGALDNASGVAAVLAAAVLLPADDGLPIGVLLTSGEELGLAGARAWASGTAPATALNCDGVDDVGEVVIMHSGRSARPVLEALGSAAGTGPPLRSRRLLPGILTDHVALADAGWATATVSRGNARTLRRIHTSADSIERLRGDGLLPVARLLAAAAVRLARPADATRSMAGGDRASGRVAP